MYNKRIKIFIIFIASLLLLCLLRLAQMQLLSGSFYREQVAKLKLQKGLYRQLKTIRGKILDRKGKILAADKLQFELHINYRLSSFMDERLRRAKLLKAAREPNPTAALSNLQKELQRGLEDLQQIIDKCTYFGLKRADIESKIKNINNRIWNLRTFVAWMRNGPSPDVLEKYNHKINSIPLSQAIADFEKKFPDEDRRLLLTAEVDDIVELNKSGRILELKTDDDVFTAQLEFMNINGVKILPKAHRFYPFQSVACQTIGWVGQPQKSDKKLFAEDRLSSYLEDEEEVCGREDGTEYVCETILRGRRGEIVYDIDRRLTNRTQTEFGKDVSLTLDIELQKRIENYLSNSELNPKNYKAPTAAVVIEVATGDILALVSLPSFDLNRARYDYDALASEPNEPLRNRAINKQFPPGSVVKPLILIAGLESGKITPDEIISCPAQKAPNGWPSCWLYNRYSIGHDDKWSNHARNAIKGSCNIYFSRLADRIDPSVLQQWLFKFGYGHKIHLSYPGSRDPNDYRASPQDALRRSIEHRNLRQAPGIISSANPEGTIAPEERRLFGMGQGNLRATPLQVANAMAILARGGLYKPPRLFVDSSCVVRDAYGEKKNTQYDIRNTQYDSIDLNISPQTLDVVHDGMSAVVSEAGGTAYKEFAPVLTSLAEQDVTVYGKTGSTEKPDNAWFAGFAKDSAGRAIAIAVVIEGGQHGSADAAPLARDIIQFCIEAEYIGKSSRITE